MGTSFSVDKVKKFIENFIVILNRMQIRAALNQQTAVQFSQYASQQSPGNKQQVSVVCITAISRK